MTRCSSPCWRSESASSSTALGCAGRRHDALEDRHRFGELHRLVVRQRQVELDGQIVGRDAQRLLVLLDGFVEAAKPDVGRAEIRARVAPIRIDASAAW